LATCPNCGAEIRPETSSSSCPVCGYSFTQDLLSGLLPTHLDFSAVSRFRTFSVFLLAYAVVGAISSALGTNASDVPGIVLPLAIEAMAAALSVASVLILFSSFRWFARLDGRRFSLVEKVTVLLLVGYSLGFVASLVLLGGVVPATSRPVAAIGIDLLGISVVLGIPGVIGATVGVWRVGARYGSILVRIGAVMFLLSYNAVLSYYVGIAAAIVLMWGAIAIRRALSQEIQSPRTN
jgi:hypothetical protein